MKRNTSSRAKRKTTAIALREVDVPAFKQHRVKKARKLTSERPVWTPADIRLVASKDSQDMHEVISDLRVYTEHSVF
jgi:hypothetical protein